MMGHDNMVSEPPAPLSACAQEAMVTTETHDARVQQMLQQILARMDAQGRKLDDIGSSLAATTSRLRGAAADSTPSAPSTTVGLATVSSWTVAAQSTVHTFDTDTNFATPTKCSTSGLDPNVDDAKFTTMPLLSGGVPTVLRVHVERAKASSPRSFAIGELDTVMPPRCSMFCHNSNTGDVDVGTVTLLETGESKVVPAPMAPPASTCSSNPISTTSVVMWPPPMVWVERHPWPPPGQEEIVCDRAELRPTSWPAFLRFRDGGPWKQRWPPSMPVEIRCDRVAELQPTPWPPPARVNSTRIRTEPWPTSRPSFGFNRGKVLSKVSWLSPTGKEESNYKTVERLLHSGPTRQDGSKFIGVSSDKKGLIYDGKTGEKIGEMSSEGSHTGSIYAVSWSPDSKQVLTVSADKTAKVWDILEDASGKLNRTLVCPGTGGVDDMLVGCLWQNDYLVTVSLGGTFNLFSASNPDKEPVTFAGHLKTVSALAFFPQSNPRTILSTSYDGVIIRWIQGVGYGGRLMRKNNTQIKCFAAAEEELVTSGYDNKVFRIPLNGDQCGDAESVDVGGQPNALNLAVQQPEFALITTDSGIILLHKSKVTSTTKVNYTITSSAVSPDGTEAVVGAQDGKLRIYSISGDTLTEEAVLEKHRGAITSIRYSPDVSMFASADANREAVVWDRATREVKLKNMLYHTARINCLAWSPDNCLVATGSLDTCAIVYEIDKPASSRITIKGAHLGGVHGLTFADNDSLVTAGEDACVRVWKLVQQ